jgi:hypothetical protein
VATRDELEQLSTPELHSRSTRHALRHGHLKWLWNLERMLPAAEASVGELDEADNDIDSIYGRIDDIKESREGEAADLLRPYYIDYILEHNA